MAKQLLIKAKQRENKKPNALRQEGYVPATIYGHGLNSESIQISAKEFSKIPHKTYSHINEIEIEGKEKYPVLIRNVQIDPVNDRFLNIEFYRIKSDEKIKVRVPLSYVGHSPAVIAGGVLIVSYNEIEVQCLPKDIPDFIEVNLEQIVEIGQGVQAKDLKVAENIQILAQPNEVMAKVEIAKTHEIEEEKPVVAEGAEVPAPGAATTPEAAAATGTPQATKEAAPAKGGGAPGGKQAAQGASKTPETKPKK